MLQQCLPFTVLKQADWVVFTLGTDFVATVLTVYGIETLKNSFKILKAIIIVATVLTVYGIETLIRPLLLTNLIVATVFTVYGIETQQMSFRY